MASHGHAPSKYKPGEVAWGAEHHILPVFTYIKVFVLLTILMVATIAAAQFDIGHGISGVLGWGSAAGSVINNIIAMSIAILKAFLVVSFFMHVMYTTPMVKLYAIGGFVWFLTMFAILIDHWTRPMDPSIAQSWMHDPGSALPKNPGGPTSYDADKEAVNVRPRN
jgi:cytochrome c oxidase subunit 4